jgi:hypothetical protein
MTYPNIELTSSKRSYLTRPNKILGTTIIIYTHMNSSILLEKEEEDYEQQLQLEQGIPVCGANLSSPVVDQAYYIDEIHYRIGNRVYIENAD